MTDKTKVKTATRRKFLTGAAGVAAGGAAAIAMPNVATAAPTVLKVQAAWGRRHLPSRCQELCYACEQDGRQGPEDRPVVG